MYSDSLYSARGRIIGSNVQYVLGILVDVMVNKVSWSSSGLFR
jgi:hypothetical protein